MTDLKPKPEEQWPAVSVAYDFVIPSYNWMATRLEANVSRIQALMTFTATITLGFPVLGQAINKTIMFHSASFISAIGFFLVIMILGIVARHMGNFELVNPTKLYNESLHLSEWEFKRDAIFHAGRSFSHNAVLSNRKARIAMIMSGCLLAEVLAFLTWIV